MPTNAYYANAVATAKRMGIGGHMVITKWRITAISARVMSPRGFRRPRLSPFMAPGQYGPNQKMLRRDFVLMLCRAFDFTGGSGYSFADVPTNAYYANAPGRTALYRASDS